MILDLQTSVLVEVHRAVTRLNRIKSYVNELEIKLEVTKEKC